MWLWAGRSKDNQQSENHRHKDTGKTGADIQLPGPPFLAGPAALGRGGGQYHRLEGGTLFFLSLRGAVPGLKPPGKAVQLRQGLVLTNALQVHHITAVWEKMRRFNRKGPHA